MKRRKPGMPDRRYRVLTHQVGPRDEGVEVLGFGGPDPSWDAQAFRERLGFRGREMGPATPTYTIASLPCPGVWTRTADRPWQRGNLTDGEP